MNGFKDTGIRLRRARQAACFSSAKEFCEHYNIPSSTYSLHETGGRSLKPETAEKYAQLLNVNTVWLLTGAGEPYECLRSKPAISDEAFIQLLIDNNVKDNSAAHSKHIDLHIFSILIISMQRTLSELAFKLDDDQIAERAKRIYENILNSVNTKEEQISLLNQATLSFRHEIEQLKKGV